MNSTSASLYNKEDYVYDYVGWVMKHKIYDITGEEYDKEKYEKGKEEARKQIDIEVTKGAYEQLKTLKKEIQDEDVTSSLFVLIKRIEKSKETFKSLVPMKGEVVAGAKLINYQLELERYPVDTSEIKKTIVLGLKKIISSIDNKVNKAKSKEYLEIEDAISSLGISKDEGLDFNNL